MKSLLLLLLFTVVSVYKLTANENPSFHKNNQQFTFEASKQLSKELTEREISIKKAI